MAVAVLTLSFVCLGQSEEIVFDLQELEPAKTVRELEDILLGASDQSSETLRILNETVTTCQKRLRNCSAALLHRASLRFNQASRVWCFATTRPEVHQLARRISFMNISSVVLLKNFRVLESKAPDVVLIGARRSLMREVEILRQYEGPAAESLVRSRLARARGLLQRVLRSNLIHAAELIAQRTHKGRRRRTRTVQRQRVLAMENELRKEFGSRETSIWKIIEIFTRHNQSPKEDELLNRQIQNLNDAKVNVSGCSMSKECVSKGLASVRTAAVRLWLGSPSAVHAVLLSNQTALVRACLIRCIAEKSVLRTYSLLMMNDISAYLRTISTLFSTFCDSEVCLEPYFRVFLNPKNRTFVFSAFRGSFEALPLILPVFSDRGLALGGIVVCSTMMASLVVLVVFGLLWKTLWSRFVWVLLLLGVAAILTSRLFVWVNAFQVPSFDLDAFPTLGGVVSIAVGLFARLSGLLMVLVLLHFFGQSKVLTVIWAVTGVASTIFVASIVLVVFVTPEFASALSDDLENLSTVRSATQNILFIPNAVISGLSFVASGILLSFLLMGLSKQAVVQATGKETYFGYLRMTSLVAFVFVTYTVIFAIALMRLPIFALQSQLLFVAIDALVAESSVLAAFMLMILNSWMTSWKLMSLKAKLLHSASDENDRSDGRYSY